jgi:nicotinamidase-related amidase
MTGSRKRIIIDPKKTALVVIDMQSELNSIQKLLVLSALIVEDYFLHPSFFPAAAEGRATVPALIEVVREFRRSGIKIIWTEVISSQKFPSHWE